MEVQDRAARLASCTQTAERVNVITVDADLRPYIGAKGSIPVQKNRESGYDLTVRVVVRQARKLFGRIELLVEPIAGSGVAWVKLDRVSFDGGVVPRRSRL
jgi:hypothetical protein